MEESLKQSLYECQRQLRDSRAMESAYQEEIKSISDQTKMEHEKLAKKVHQLEEKIAGLRKINEEKDTEIVSRDSIIANLRQELEAKQQCNETGKEITLNDLDDLAKWKDENAELLQQVSDLEMNLKKKDEELVQVSTLMAQLQKDLDNYKESLGCKREELTEANNLNKTLKDENFEMKSELDCLRNKPLDEKSQGNSLFAEVNDRRILLENKLKAMKSNYLEMRQERGSLLAQIKTLRSQNLELISQMKNEKEAARCDENRLIDTLRYEIKTLKDLNDSYSRELASNDVTCDNHRIFNSLMKEKKDELETMRQQLRERNFNLSLTAKDLLDANKEIRRNKLDILQLKTENEDLKAKAEEEKILQANKENEVGNEIKSIMKKKENGSDSDSKTLEFSQDSTDTNITVRRKNCGVKFMN